MGKRKLLNKKRKDVNSQTQSKRQRQIDDEHQTLTPTHVEHTQSQLEDPIQMEDNFPSPIHSNDEVPSQHQQLPEEIGHSLRRTQQKRFRGPTFMPDLWELPAKECILVELNDFGQPIGEEACSLTRFIGVLVRTHTYAPIDIKSWKEMPQEYRDAMLTLIESKFQFTPHPFEATKTWILRDMANKWRQWKRYLKEKAYDPTKSRKEMAKNIPDTRVDKRQYRKLVKYWCSKKAKKKKEGVTPSRAKVYITTRTSEHGGFLSNETQATVEKMDTMIAQDVDYENTLGTESWEDDLYSKVKGIDKGGRVRCMGMISKSLKTTTPRVDKLKEQMEFMARVMNDFVTGIKEQFPDIILSSNVVEAVESAQQIVRKQVPNARNAPNININREIHSPEITDRAVQDGQLADI
ncbi:hypothetical protein SLEP1_g1810 [Rubroshorea leprosula]|uniref:Transposase n=1 Tax=Rubroshorea leprosula TaxID=152421 RepID=A0AAV5HF29_9ROSI|nr:hypothetical protein SLEP1_g1810 [Rubroshorea leprosula]